MDALFWGPHWYAPSDDEFLLKVQRALEPELFMNLPKISVTLSKIIG
jgi:hypothetical protein